VTFAVLFVCTGNICRSPMAERLLAARLPESARDQVAVSSAGTHALVGYEMDGPSAQVLAELGGDGRDHVGRRLKRPLVDAADLILTATVAHRSQVLRESPGALRRAFTLLEFVRLGAPLTPAGQDEDGLRRRVAEVAGQRGLVDPPEPGADDIADPYRQPMDVVRACGAQISAAIDGVLGVLGLRSF
jgi:protein-tyrosine phosphatase